MSDTWNVSVCDVCYSEDEARINDLEHKKTMIVDGLIHDAYQTLHGDKDGIREYYMNGGLLHATRTQLLAMDNRPSDDQIARMDLELAKEDRDDGVV